MNQNTTISIQTQNKIRKLSHSYFRLWGNYENYKTLEKLFLKIPVNNSKILLFLKEKNLITDSDKITPLGLTLIIANRFNVRVLSVFILSKIYHHAIKTSSDSILPRPTLITFFDSFSNKETIRRIISSLKQMNLLESIGVKQLRLQKTAYTNLQKYHDSLLLISEYVDEITEKIDELISCDPLVQKTRVNNSKMWENGLKND